MERTKIDNGGGAFPRRAAGAGEAQGVADGLRDLSA